MSFLDHPYDTPTKEEKRDNNKQAALNACGNKWSYYSGFDGQMQKTTTVCKNYRDCNKYCRHHKFEELEKRIHTAQMPLPVGDLLRFITITENEKEAFSKKLSRKLADKLSIPQPNGEYIIIHNDIDGPGDQLWEIGYDDIDLEDNGFDLNFYTILQNIPQGKNISGNLGRLKEDDEEKDGNGDKEEEEKKTPVKIPCIYKPSLTERDANLAFTKAITKTQNINVANEIELEKAMFARINAMAELIPDSQVYFTFGAATQEEIESWNKNPNNFSDNVVKINLNTDNVQILDTIEDSSRRKTDKYTDGNHKQSSFEAVKERAIVGDGLENDRQQALEDFLHMHGT